MRLTHRRATLHLAEPFRISRETSVAEEVVWVEIEHDGVSGFGEAAPQSHYGVPDADDTPGALLALRVPGRGGVPIPDAAPVEQAATARA